MPASRFIDHLLEGTHAARPAASAVPEGALYSCTDHGLIYQSDGTSAWSTWATLGSGAIPASLADNVGDTLVASAADTFIKRKNNDSATAAPAVTDDSSAGYAIGSRWIDTTNDKEYVAADVSVGAAVWKETTAAGAGGSDWTGTLISTADHVITNIATMTAHAPASGPVLEFAVDAASKYFAEFWIAYSGNDVAGDYKWDFSIPTLSAAAQVQGWHSGVSTTLASQFASGGAIGTTTAWPSSPAFVGTDASHTIFMFHGQFTVVTNGAGTITFRFANAAASAGRESTTRAGSMLRYRKIG